MIDLSDFAVLETKWNARRQALLDDLKRSKSTGNGINVDIARGRQERSPSIEVLAGIAAYRHMTNDTVRPAVRGRALEPSQAEPRDMKTRLQNVASGSQPAVVKMISYGSGARIGSMTSYVSRSGEIPLEDEKGEFLTSKADLAQIRGKWDEYVSNRLDSRDIASFSVSIDPDQSISGSQSINEVLSSAFGDRKYVYSFTQSEGGEISVKGQVVLRSGQGERLTADQKATEIIQSRYDESDLASTTSARFKFDGHGNGINYGKSTAEKMFSSNEGPVFNHKGNQLVENARLSYQEKKPPIEKEVQSWRNELFSKKARDVMHVMISAKAGTNPEKFNSAVRDFLGNQFEGHKYVFAVHDPATDPKEASLGGKRPHIHAHAIITMKSEFGNRVHPNIKSFKQWRENMALSARENGIAMEMTDRRELATAKSYGRSDVEPIDQKPNSPTYYRPTSDSARIRVRNKLVETPTLSRSTRTNQFVVKAQNVWSDIAATAVDKNVESYANTNLKRLDVATRLNDQFFVNNVIDATTKFEEEVKAMPELNPTEVANYQSKVDSAVKALDGSNITEEGKERIIAAAGKTLQATQAFVEKKAEFREGLDDKERDNYDKLTLERQELNKSLDGREPTPKESERLKGFDSQLEKIENGDHHELKSETSSGSSETPVSKRDEPTHFVDRDSHGDNLEIDDKDLQQAGIDPNLPTDKVAQRDMVHERLQMQQEAAAKEEVANQDLKRDQQQLERVRLAERLAENTQER